MKSAKTSKPAISIKKLSKAYMIGHEKQAAPGTMTLRDSLTNLARKPLELFTGHQLQKEKFWALKDINLDIAQGDVVGIIGRNGSGKSTMLKILSRIVEPTKGEVIMRGRVASLLEVGTGFHPELTGRENVFFNGAILGMSRREIKAKFDEIIEFSEVEKFLDTPVKFYSSGMYVRLAFAVAAHLDPDILIVDEVLAVGDAAFQKKSLRKMKDIAESGKTVIFVSHSMDSVRALCGKAVLLESGRVVYSGAVEPAISQYYKVGDDSGTGSYKCSSKVKPDEYIQSIALGTDSRKTGIFTLNETITASIDYKITESQSDCLVSLEVLTRDEHTLLFTSDSDQSARIEEKKPGQYTAKVTFKNGLFMPGRYIMRIALQLPGRKIFDVQEVPFLINPDKDDPRDSFFGGSHYIGYINAVPDWKTETR